LLVEKPLGLRSYQSQVLNVYLYRIVASRVPLLDLVVARLLLFVSAVSVSAVDGGLRVLLR